MEYTTIYFLINPTNTEDIISITQMDDTSRGGIWVARRYCDPRMDMASLRNWDDEPFIATSESWNCREGQRDFWNKCLEEE